MTVHTDNIEKYIKEGARETETALAQCFENSDEDIASLYDAMAYSTLGAGKRIRAFLVLEFCRIFGGDIETAKTFACALEMIHAFSLIHDDLPCMDNDDMRRGKPSCHVKYGEAQALIAGDALLILAFETACSANAEPRTVLEAVRLLSENAGARGMCGGQIMDMHAESVRVPYEYLKKMQSLKTGALIEAAARLGCIAAGADGKACEDAVKYASCIGRAFQIVDDILDVEGDEASLGKPVGSDSESNKSTFVTELGIEGARAEAKRLSEMAKEYIVKYKGAQNLLALSDWLLERKN